MEKVLRLRRVAAIILNKQSRTADTKSSSSLGVGYGAKKTLTLKNLLLLNISKLLGLELILSHEISNGKRHEIL